LYRSADSNPWTIQRISAGAFLAVAGRVVRACKRRGGSEVQVAGWRTGEIPYRFTEGDDTNAAENQRCGLGDTALGICRVGGVHRFGTEYPLCRHRGAKAAGDQNVWFIDGETFFGEEDRETCTIEGCHPNDLGFMRMAQTIYPVLKAMVGVSG